MAAPNPPDSPPTTPTTPAARNEPPVRIDAWVWAVRLMPTRTAAGNACETGKIKVNGSTVKPAKKIGAGDVVEVRNPAGSKTVRVTRTISKRVGAPIAVTCYDLIAEEVTHGRAEDGIAVWAHRERGTGRPTKRDRRQIEAFRGRGG